MAFPWLMAAAALQVFGTIQGGRQARAIGNAQDAAAAYEAQQLESNAKQSVAVAQQKMLEERRKAGLVASRALALSAASGGASDKSVVNIISDIQGEGSYRAMLALYDGEDRARVLRDQSKGRRYEGGVARRSGQLKERASYLQAAGQATSMFAKFNPGGAAKTGGDNWGSLYDKGVTDY